MLGVDVGTRRIGLAVSDATGTLATPLRTLETTGSIRDAIHRVAPIVRSLAAGEDGLARIVVGLPMRLDGEDAPWTDRVRAFARALGRAVDVPIVLQDERLSSREADARLAVGERDWRTRKARLDAAAAAVILQDHLDTRRAEAPAPVPRDS